MNDKEVARGKRIPGSAYVREFCQFCGTPMRIYESDYDPDCRPSCERCGGRCGRQQRGEHITARQRAGLGRTSS